MISFDKNEILEQLTTDYVFELVESFGGNPQMTSFGFVCETICHNPPGQGSKKLYYYENKDKDMPPWFQCYTGCGTSFDTFELVSKVAKIQWGKDFNLNDSVRYVAQKFGLTGSLVDDGLTSDLADWQILANYERIQEVEFKINNITLKEYDKDILNKFNYSVKIEPWLAEGISQEAMELAQIGYYPGDEQITIPHFDINGRFVGLRGRSLSEDDSEFYGKYRPIRIGKDQTYNHPLSYNLYGLNWNKEAISKIKKAIIVESEKSVLLYESYFGREANICVACCGSNISAYQIELLRTVGAEEVVVGFDRDFKKIGDEEFEKFKNHLIKINNKYKNLVRLSFIFDRKLLTPYKASPLDKDAKTFMRLFKERISL